MGPGAAPDLLVGEVFRAGARAEPDRVAVALGDRTLTFAEVDRSANAHAHALRRAGVGHGDRVVLWSATAIDAVPLFAALAKIGAVFAPASALLTPDEALETVGRARPGLLVVDPGHEVAGREVAAALGIPLWVLGRIVAEPGAGPDGPDAPDPPDPEVPGLRETDPHVLFFTSGTTGRSKGVVLSHRVSYLRSHPGSQLEPRGPVVCMYPLFHMGAWTMALTAWQQQTTVVFVEHADPALLCAEIARWRAERFNAIPAVWRRIFEHVDGHPEARAGLQSLRIVDSGTSATPLELLREIAALVPGAARRVFYGSTEAGAVCLLRDEHMEAKPGSCGTPQHSVRVRLDPETHELQVRGPLLFDGYFEDAEATAEVTTADGWFRTGDVAAEDADGFLSIVGRLTQVIRTGGEALSPVEVELELADHPGLLDVAVVGLPDPRWGETVCAAIVVRPGAPAPTLEELRAHAAGRLAKFKLPRAVVVVDAIPRTPATGQVQRMLLVAQVTGRGRPGS
ncbi:MAG: class I adenylate-forming enzyme family protein [Actinomycetota bacterium]